MPADPSGTSSVDSRDVDHLVGDVHVVSDVVTQLVRERVSLVGRSSRVDGGRVGGREKARSTERRCGSRSGFSGRYLGFGGGGGGDARSLGRGRDGSFGGRRRARSGSLSGGGGAGSLGRGGIGVTVSSIGSSSGNEVPPAPELPSVPSRRRVARALILHRRDGNERVQEKKHVPLLGLLERSSSTLSGSDSASVRHGSVIDTTLNLSGPLRRDALVVTSRETDGGSLELCSRKVKRNVSF